MSLTPEQVVQVAHLARLEIQSEQVDKYARELSNIFDLVDQLQQAEVGDAGPMAHPMDMVQRLRVDAVTEADRRDTYQSFAPSTEDGLYLVPKVIE